MNQAKAKAVAIPSTNHQKRLPGTGRNTHNPASNPGSALKFAARLREKQACELRLNGLTYKEIGAKLAITDMGAYKIIMRCLARELNEIRERIPAMRKGDLKAITVALKIAERRARLAGLDSPVDVKLTGTGEGGAISVEVFRKMLDDSRVETDAVAEIEAAVRTIECEVIASDIAIPEGRKPI